MSYETLGKLLAKYVRERALRADEKAYTDSLWKDIKTLLDEFVEYMHNDNLDIYAANCSNTGYKRPGQGNTLVIANVGDRIMCTLMSRALFFMNRWRPGSASADQTDTTSAALKEHIRCAIVNIFMYILLASPCKSQMGVYYAWYTMKQLEDGLRPGLINDGKCAQGVFQNIKASEWNMGKKIKNWLESNKSLTEKIGGQGIESTCTKKLAQLDGARQDANDMDDKIELRPEEKTVIQKLGQELKVIVEEVKKAAVQCAQANGACMEPIEAVSRSDPEDNDTQATVSNSVAGGTTATEPT
ncbi:hypothetical protein AK88_05358, partial [Plasmodium fragile]